MICFLTDRQYSCAYFHDPDDTQEQAQAAKKHYIAPKLMIEPGMRVLDIGCDWGCMARDYGAIVLGITLSEQQHAYATKTAAREGLTVSVEYRLCDYRDVTGTFDRIVSVGMFEHVGLPHYNTYFKIIRERLTPDGIALVHTIGWTAPPDATNPWIAKYIFPGGYIPTMSEVMKAVEQSRLWATDIACLRLHYATTLRHWSDWFEANHERVRASLEPDLRIIALHRSGQTAATLIGRMRLKTDDILLLESRRDQIDLLERDTDMPLLMPPHPEPPVHREVIYTPFAPLFAIAAGTSGLLPLSVALMLAVLGLVSAGRFSLQNMFGMISWRILILIGCMSSFGVAMQASGTASWLAGAMLSGICGFGPLAVLLGLGILLLMLPMLWLLGIALR